MSTQNYKNENKTASMNISNQVFYIPPGLGFKNLVSNGREAEQPQFIKNKPTSRRVIETRNKFDSIFENLNLKKEYAIINKIDLRNSPLKYFQNNPVNRILSREVVSTAYYSPTKSFIQKNKDMVLRTQIQVQKQEQKQDQEQVQESVLSMTYNPREKLSSEENKNFVNRINNILNYDIHNSDKFIPLYNLKNININTSKGIITAPENNSHKISPVSTSNIVQNIQNLNKLTNIYQATETLTRTQTQNRLSNVKRDNHNNSTYQGTSIKDPFNGFLINLKNNETYSTNNNLYLNKKRCIGEINIPVSVNSVSNINTSTSFNIKNTILTKYDYSNNCLNYDIKNLSSNCFDEGFSNLISYTPLVEDNKSNLSSNIKTKLSGNINLDTVKNNKENIDLNSKILAHFENMTKKTNKEFINSNSTNSLNNNNNGISSNGISSNDSLEVKPKSILKIKTQEESLNSQIGNKPGMKTLIWKSNEELVKNKIFLFTDEPNAGEVSKEEYEFIQNFIKENS